VHKSVALIFIKISLIINNINQRINQPKTKNKIKLKGLPSLACQHEVEDPFSINFQIMLRKAV
jgi:hypothetical protein